MREWLKRLRKERGFTQEFVAEQLAVSRVNYTKIENGKAYRSLPLDVAGKLAKILGVTLQFVFEQEKINSA